MAPGPPDLVGAGVDEESVQPGVESGRVAQRGQITPGADEGVLDGVHRQVRVPEHEPGGGVEPGDRGACQHGEGVMIAPSRPLHEVSAPSRPSAVARLIWPRSRVWRADVPVWLHLGRRASDRPATRAMIEARPGTTRPEVRSPREDPRSRREVAAPRPGTARPRVGGGQDTDPGPCGRRPIPRRPGQRDGQGGDQGAGPRRRPRQGRRCAARRRRGRGGGRRGPDPRARDQGPAGATRARRPGRGDREGVLPLGRARPRDPAPDVHRLGGGRRGDRAGRRRQPRGDRLRARRSPPRPAGLRGPRAGVQDRVRAPLEGGRGDRQGPPADDDRDRRRPRGDQPARRDPRAQRGRDAGGAPGLPRRQDHPRRLGPGPASRSSRRCATSTPRTPPTSRRAATTSRSSSSRATSAAWSTAPASR